MPSTISDYVSALERKSARVRVTSQEGARRLIGKDSNDRVIAQAEIVRHRLSELREFVIVRPLCRRVC
jgi:phosphopantothenoylcysteine synthetase/decarboxylase